jgi:hypothetical protein
LCFVWVLPDNSLLRTKESCAVRFSCAASLVLVHTPLKTGGFRKNRKMIGGLFKRKKIPSTIKKTLTVAQTS